MTAPGRSLHIPHLAAISFLSILLTWIIFSLEQGDLLESLDLRAYDLMVAAQHHEPPSSEVINVDFDDDFVRRHNAFPIPRLLLADIIEKIAQGKPSVIGVDVILDVARAEADDARLAKVIDDAGNVVLVNEYGFATHQQSDPLESFRKAAAGVAFGDLPIDEDGAVRRMFLRVTTEKYKGLSLPVALADLASEQHLRPGGEGFLLFGRHKLPLARTNPDSAWIHFHPSAPTTVISAGLLLATDFDATIFANKVVIVGQSSEMGKDLFTTPASRAGIDISGRRILSGAEIHGAAVASLLHGNALSTMHILPRVFAGVIFAFIVILLAVRSRWSVALIACTVLATGIFVVAMTLFSWRHVWVPPVSMELCLVAALPAGLGYRSVEERRQKVAMEAERRQLMGLFERYVSADVAAEIWKNRDAIVLAGEERVATILFSDIRSFTATTAGVPSSEVLAWLNRYLTVMSDMVKKNRGFLNKFIGDGIMVVFGAPLTEGAKEDACRALRCAVEMLARVDEWNANKAPGDPPLKIGIGIHTGQVTAGNVGSPDRLEYSVIGEAVNLASRLESLTKDCGAPIVFSPATCELVRDQFTVVSLGERPVRGFTTDVPLYSVKLPSPDEVSGEVNP
jgi:adenylate cyclase